MKGIQNDDERIQMKDIFACNYNYYYGS